MQMKRILNRFLVGCTTLVLLATSCEIQENFKYEPANVDGVLGVTAWEFIQTHPEFEVLRSAIIRTDLQSLYQDEERTFIIPNNNAFNTYLKNSTYNSVEDIPEPILRNMLRYHIVKDRVIFTDPNIERDLPIAYETENGQTMFLSRNNNYIGQINQGTTKQWEIRTSNLEPLNGVMHAVNEIVYFSAPAVDNSSETTMEKDTIYAIHDSFVAGGANENTNYNSNQYIRPKRMLTTDGNSADDRKGYLMFNLDDFDKPGIVIDMHLSLKVYFARGGYDIHLFEVASSDWTESTITGSNAPVPTQPMISSVFSPAVGGDNRPGTLSLDITNYYRNASPTGRASFMLDTQPWANGVDEYYTKETPDPMLRPMLVATLATGQNNLVLEKNEPVLVPKGGSEVLNEDILKISGAEASDIIYTIHTAPANGWLIRGADVMVQNDEFLQADLQSLSLIYIHNGESSGEDTLVLSAKDRTGAVLEDIEVKINIQ